jgi:hypothetical protein
MTKPLKLCSHLRLTSKGLEQLRVGTRIIRDIFASCRHSVSEINGPQVRRTMESRNLAT